MDINKILSELEIILKEELDSVSQNETYDKLFELYPISVNKIINNLKNDLLEFERFAEIAYLVEQYKKNSDFIANNNDITKISRLFDVLGEKMLSDNNNQLAVKKEQQKKIKQRLDILGFEKIHLFEQGQKTREKTNFENRISAGSTHILGLKSNGTVVAVGENNYGQCNITDWKDIVAVSAGGSHTVGLKSDGTVVAVGDNMYGQCNVQDWNLFA